MPAILIRAGVWLLSGLGAGELVSRMLTGGRSNAADAGTIAAAVAKAAGAGAIVGAVAVILWQRRRRGVVVPASKAVR